MTDQEDQKQNSGTPEDSLSSDFESASKPKQVLLTDEELKNLQHEIVEYKDKYLRVLAEQENARKRLQKERIELSKFATESIIADMLRPIDNLENALNYAQAMSEEVRNWAIGFQMILTQFKDILSSNGVTAIEAKGKAFDPHYHEAVEMVETEDVIPGIVMEECMRGYKMGDKTIRPARVKVSKSRAGKTEELLLEDKEEEKPKLEERN